MKRQRLYLMTDAHVQVVKLPVCMADICDVFCQDTDLTEMIRAIPLLVTKLKPGERMVISVVTLYEVIEETCAAMELSYQLDYVNLGGTECILEMAQPKKSRVLEWIKTGSISLIILVGSAFTIMTYDQDVDVTGVFARLYGLILGKVPDQPGILEAAYAFGVAIGVILFFNPLTPSKKRKEPSPIEIEMEEYETKMRETLIKMHDRGE